MKNNSLLLPLFKTIDKLLFGIEEIKEIEKNQNIFSVTTKMSLM